MKKLSARQQAILDYIRGEVLQKGYPPSVREIGEAVGLASSSTVHGHLARLEKKGHIRRDPTKPRAIELIGEENDEVASETASIQVPVIGKVTAGEPITAIENIEEYMPMPATLVHNEESFILEISGDSMIEAGIFDGDYVVVQQQNTAANGEIVVAMTDENEATVKRFFKEKDHFRLQPENTTLEPIILDNVQILGKVVGVFRSLH
ncbi:transcriptional repressor LexA [Salisediminibacterium halotolerans]|uniref:transcriptional repressor LexA n=1 Tax=Salisediminibacterium halotolerans TaxID=517425 RepID=UPI000EB3C140|nr:transcriptional repressor LexA [Salisediminibacterium halotolerans]RLJ74137.1 SOS-response transcriptional repressor LexA [Actinophytocola xinjiangensis]RPE87770.1 SOS-response transcriptional repressor LexA [Salisediminibacterium halotolerans]TWG34974.1 SOS-response transcriptional repressor LexA [Salisediminibacterium halotolerans]GEL07691.1 LexA repressor [Salisediminibacterium halotolerans]